MTDDQVALIVCMRVDQPGIYVVPGSVQAPCERCGTQVWVAGSTFKMMFGTPKLFICMRCVGDDETGLLGESILHGPEPEQATEIAQFHDEIEEHFRD
jgi:hypothetical protein